MVEQPLLKMSVMDATILIKVGFEMRFFAVTGFNNVFQNNENLQLFYDYL
jgi:hypothetical protein